MKKIVLFSILMSTAVAAHGQGLSGAVSGYNGTGDTKGLCTSDNSEEMYYKEGVCQSLKEQLSDDKCTAPLLEKLRQKLIQQSAGKPDPDPKKQFNVTSEFNCESRDGTDQYDKVIKNKQVFGTIMMQFFMAVAVAESSLDEFNGLEKSPGQNINEGRRGGLMNLTLSQMDDPKYNKGGCGCHVTNSSEQVAWFWSLFVGERAYAVDFLPGNSPGPRDAHHSIQCGAYIALYEAAQDGTLYGGNKKGKGSNGSDDSKPQGAAKIFQSLQEWNTPYKKDDDLAANPQLNLIRKKLQNYCRKNMNPNGTLIHTMDQDFPNGGTAIRDNAI